MVRLVCIWYWVAPQSYRASGMDPAWKEPSAGFRYITPVFKLLVRGGGRRVLCTLGTFGESTIILSLLKITYFSQYVNNCP